MSGLSRIDIDFTDIYSYIHDYITIEYWKEVTPHERLF